MKKMSHELRYPGASLAEVQAMLSDPAFREAVGDAQRVVSQQVTIDGSIADGDSMSVRQEQVQSTTGVPGFAKKIVGETTTIVANEAWTSATAADLTIAIPGKPGEMSGTIDLAEVGDGVVETVALAITVGIPLVGGKIEGLLADLMTSALKAENRTGTTWLADR